MSVKLFYQQYTTSVDLELMPILSSLIENEDILEQANNDQFYDKIYNDIKQIDKFSYHQFSSSSNFESKYQFLKNQKNYTKNEIIQLIDILALHQFLFRLKFFNTIEVNLFNQFIIYKCKNIEELLSGDDIKIYDLINNYLEFEDDELNKLPAKYKIPAVAWMAFERGDLDILRYLFSFCKCHPMHILLFLKFDEPGEDINDCGRILSFAYFSCKVLKCLQNFCGPLPYGDVYQEIKLKMKLLEEYFPKARQINKKYPVRINKINYKDDILPYKEFCKLYEHGVSLQETVRSFIRRNAVVSDLGKLPEKLSELTFYTSLSKFMNYKL